MNDKLPDVYGYLDENGLLAGSFEGFEYRDGQLEMALLVQQAYQDKAVAVIEAGTGIGKSFAYLVPAIMNARRHDDEERTVIATATKNLQMQLSHKDVPQLLALSNEDCKVAPLFGRANYVCLRRLEDLRRGNPLLVGDDENDISRFCNFVSGTESGLFQDYPGRLSEEIFNSTCSDSDFCQGKRCPFIRECFYLKAKREASQADIVITNHHLLFTDAASRAESGADFDSDGILPPYSRLIIDEAHNIEQNATDLFTAVYSGYNVSKQLGFLLRPRFGGQESIVDRLSRFCLAEGKAEAIRNQANMLNAEMATLDLFLTGLIGEKASSRSILIRNPDSEGLAPFYPIAGRLVEAARNLTALLRDFSKSLRFPEEEQIIVQEFDALTSRVESSFEALRDFAARETWSDDAHFIRESRVRNQRVLEICISPISIASLLRESLFSKLKTVVCTSATLDLNDGFGYWSARVGLPVEGKGFLKLAVPSPFDFRHNLLLLTPVDAPEYVEGDSGDFSEYAVRTIYDAISSAGGGALVLFTNKKFMEWTHAQLDERLSGIGIKAWVQGNGAGRYMLLNKFKNDPDSVLFATSSFWEGIDAPGDTLRLVIIVKLPFPSPGEPIISARSRKIENEGGSGFFNLLLPEAIMKLKQGYGRLIRTRNDKGIVLILDSRIVRKGYGAAMLRALPESFHPETYTEGICSKIENFLFS